MNRTELMELIHNGENSGVDFKRDDIRPERLAKAIVALLNLEGGHILLGVEDDGTVSGLARDPKQVEECKSWKSPVYHVMTGHDPLLGNVRLGAAGKSVGVIVTLPADAPDKPLQGKAWHRLGSRRYACGNDHARCNTR